MEPTTLLDKKITNYLTQLNTRQKKAVLSVVKTFAEEQMLENKSWDEPDFVIEMEKRNSELENGTVKGIGWEELKKKSKLPLRSRKGK